MQVHYIFYFFLFLLNRGKELSPQEPQSSNGGRLTDRVTYCHVVPSMHSTTHCRGHTTSSLLTQRDRPPDIPSPFPIHRILFLIILTTPFWKTKPPGCYFPHSNSLRDLFFLNYLILHIWFIRLPLFLTPSSMYTETNYTSASIIYILYMINPWDIHSKC